MTTQQAKVGLRDFSMLIALVLISVVFWLMDSTFLSARNLSQLAIELSATAVLSLGMLLIIVPGHIDLSVGSGLGLVGGLAAVLITGHGASAPAGAARVLPCQRGDLCRDGRHDREGEDPLVHHHAWRLAHLQGCALARDR